MLITTKLGIIHTFIHSFILLETYIAPLQETTA